MQLNVVAYDEALKVELKRELFLKDAISDLPPVCNRYQSCLKDILPID